MSLHKHPFYYHALSAQTFCDIVNCDTIQWPTLDIVLTVPRSVCHSEGCEHIGVDCNLVLLYITWFVMYKAQDSVLQYLSEAHEIKGTGVCPTPVPGDSAAL